MTSNWLQAYLVEAVGRNLCTQVYCTTCGAMEFRRGVLSALAKASGGSPRPSFDRDAVVKISAALAGVTPTKTDSEEFVSAVRCLLCDLWSGVPLLDRPIEVSLAGSWAGEVLSAMKAHHAARQAERRAREEFQDPATVKKRRAEKKRLKQEQHAKRLLLKKERDRIWRAEHGNTGRARP